MMCRLGSWIFVQEQGDRYLGLRIRSSEFKYDEHNEHSVFFAERVSLLRERSEHSVGCSFASEARIIGLERAKILVLSHTSATSR
jgi:hypothetical protein